MEAAKELKEKIAGLKEKITALDKDHDKVLEDMKGVEPDSEEYKALDIKLSELAQQITEAKSELANATKEAEEKPGDLSESNESIPEDIEAMVKRLNAKRLELVKSNPAFMENAPIGKVFAAMKYEPTPDGKDITIDIPASVATEYRSIMEANGRKVTDGKDGYSVDYPGDTVIEISKEAGGKYPSRLAWGGAEGDAKSQVVAAEAGMSMWESSITTEVPDDTELVDAPDNADINLSEELDDKSVAAKMAKELDSLKGSLEGADAVNATPFGKFIDSLDVRSVDGNAALTSSLDAKTFSHMYKELNLSAVMTGDLETHGGDGYVMQFDERGAKNVIHNLGRWAAMMGGKTESTLKAGEGDLEGGKKNAKDGDESSQEKGKEGENLLDENKEAIDLPKLHKFAKDLNKRRDQLHYSVEVSVDEEAGRILIEAKTINPEWGTAEKEGADQLIRIQAESVPRMMSATITESGALSLDIRTKHEKHGYLGDIDGEAFGKLPPEEQKSDSLGADAEGAPDELSGQDKTEESMQKLRDLVGVAETSGDPADAKALDAPIAAVRDAIGSEEAFHTSGNSDSAANTERQVILDGYKADLKEYENLYASPDEGPGETDASGGPAAGNSSNVENIA